MAKKYNIRVEWGEIVKVFKRYPKHLEKHPEYDLTIVCTDPLGKKITYEKYMLLSHTSYGKQLFVVTLNEARQDLFFRKASFNIF